MRDSITATLVWAVVGMALVGNPGWGARSERLEFRNFELELAGPPVTILSADLDHDGRNDLLVVTAFTYWGQTGSHSSREFEGRVIEAVEVIPTLVDRREFRLFLAGPDREFVPAGPAQSVPPSVHAFAEGPDEHPILVLTDAGVSEVLFDPTAESSHQLSIESLVNEIPVLAGSGTLLPDYDFTSDIDGDGDPDLLIPVTDGVAIYTFEGGEPRPHGIVTLPGLERGKNGVVWSDQPLPRVAHVNGDRHPDLVVYHPTDGEPLIRFDDRPDFGAISFLAGRGDGTFGPAISIHRPAGDVTPEGQQLEGELNYFGDLSGDHAAELVTRWQIDRNPDKDGMRASMREAKRPLFAYRLFHVNPDGALSAEPYSEFRAEGYPFDMSLLDHRPGGMVDLDADGRMELVTIGFEFSLWQTPKILVTKKVAAGLEFHVWRQREGGSFEEVVGSSPKGHMRLGFGKMLIGRMAQFAGDFDGDGKIDFVELGGDRKVSIHRGTQGCRYNPKPDLILPLSEAPHDIGLVRVRDLDGDGRSDLLVVTPLRPDDEGESRPNRLEFYLTGAGQ